MGLCSPSPLAPPKANRGTPQSSIRPPRTSPGADRPALSSDQSGPPSLVCQTTGVSLYPPLLNQPKSTVLQVAVTLGQIGLQQMLDQRLCIFGFLLEDHGEVDFPLEDIFVDFHRVVVSEGINACMHFVDEDSQSPPVNRLAVSLVEDDLGGDILRSATHCKSSSFVEDLGKTKIRQPQVAIIAHQQILRLQVSKDNVLSVQIFETGDHSGSVKAALLSGQPFHHLDIGEQFPSVYQFQNQEEVPGVLGKALKMHDKGVVNLRVDIALIVDVVNLLGLNDVIFPQHLHRHILSSPLTLSYLDFSEAPYMSGRIPFPMVAPSSYSSSRIFLREPPSILSIEILANISICVHMNSPTFALFPFLIFQFNYDGCIIMYASLRSLFKFSVRVRYAPSPTGPMHLGAVRTALFNYLFAIQNEGKFILRIEDTDLKRNIPNGADHIMQTLQWLGIQPHESPAKGGPYASYMQSERISIYRGIETQLLKKGYAYPCFCKQDGASQSKQYDGKCRGLTTEQVVSKIRSGEKYVVRIKSDIKELHMSSFKDQVFGEVTANSFDDFIITKANRWPTYHFANVIDDWKMGITHVIRGAEWLTNTPKHIYLYRLLGQKPPVFMHLPLIFTADGKKLSKRDPTAPVDSLKAKGYLPEAIINYTGLMSNNVANSDETSPAKEFFTLEELEKSFDMSNVSNSPTRSDSKKLNFFNRYYLRKKWKEEGPQGELANQFRQYIRREMPIASQFSDQYLNDAIDCVIERLDNFHSFTEYDYFFKEDNDLVEKDLKLLFGQQSVVQDGQIIQCQLPMLIKNKKILHNLRLIFEHILGPDEYNEVQIAQKISEYLFDQQDLKNEDVYHLLRLAVTGRKSGVQIVKTCRIVGRQRVERNLQRLHQMLRSAENHFGI